MATNFVRDFKSIFSRENTACQRQGIQKTIKIKFKEWTVEKILTFMMPSHFTNPVPFKKSNLLKHQLSYLVLNNLLNSTFMLKLIAYIHEIKVKEFVSRKKIFYGGEER